MANTVLNSTVWFGQSRTRSHLFLGIALIVCIAMFALHTPSIAEVLSPYGIPTGFGADLLLLIILILLLATINAYINNGIIVSLILAGAPIFGIYFASVLSPYSSSDLFSGVPFMLSATILIGFLGFLLGVGTKRLSSKTHEINS